MKSTSQHIVRVPSKQQAYCIRDYLSGQVKTGEFEVRVGQDDNYDVWHVGGLPRTTHHICIDRAAGMAAAFVSIGWTTDQKKVVPWDPPICKLEVGKVQDFLSSLVDEMYRDHQTKDHPFWSRNKPIEGADFIEAIAEGLDNLGLVPPEEACEDD